MKILVVGGGGREHAIAWRLNQSPSVTEVIASPGNPGIELLGRCISAPGNWTGYADVAEAEGVDLTVVGPEVPLVGGIVDAFRSRGLRIIGPTQAAARLEGSKIFAKEFFRRAGIPTARTFSRLEHAPYPVVIKADGLAAGKGVVIAQNRREAEEALARLGPEVVIEEFLEGEEISFIALTDGKRLLPLAPTQDHKRAFDGDQGPNTGGMGAYCDPQMLPPRRTNDILEHIMLPAIRQMDIDGTPFTGFLYAGLMMTDEGPKVLEFNVRLGDPETQALMVSMQTDLAQALMCAAEGSLSQQQLEFGSPSVCVVLAAEGYPEKPVTGRTITGLEQIPPGIEVFHAGTSMRGDALVTSGGRVLGVTSSGPSLQQAIEAVYGAIKQVHFEGMHYRRDIGWRGLNRC